LWPLSLIYGAASHLRSRAYRTGLLKSRRLGGSVISIGNLTVGGTGKTPMVLWIAERLLAEGKRVGILTRGYRGGTVATPESRAGASGTTKTSDEVQLLKARLGDRVSFGVGADRYENGRRLASQGIEWFVLDDGFQHIQLARDVDIVLIDATNPFGGGHLLPSGRLREPLGALARADIIVVTRSDHAPAIEAVIQRHSDAPVFYAQPKVDSIREVKGGMTGPQQTEERPGNLFAFCGIGNPKGFLLTLRDAGITVLGHKAFPDHHRYTARDAEQVQRDALAAGASALICTEKDLYNLGDMFEGKLKLYCVSISMKIAREDDFWAQVVSVANRK